jgi:undecaprenyl-diphosphatase
MTFAKSVRGFLEHNDTRIMKRLHRWRPPRWLRLWTILITRLGDGWLWYALGLIVLFFGGEKRYPAFGAGFMASMAGILVFRQLKLVSKRPRPCQVEPHCWAMITARDRFSFPSGHSMTAFSILVSVGHFYPELQLLFLVLALSIAASRIILGMHYLTDVAAGAAIGLGLGLASLRLVTWIT